MDIDINKKTRDLDIDMGLYVNNVVCQAIMNMDPRYRSLPNMVYIFIPEKYKQYWIDFFSPLSR